MKFGHIADVHLGGWRDPKLRDANTRSFIKAIDVLISEQVDFLIIAGDLFNTALPAIDCLKVCVQKLKELKERKIPVYFIAGSHDFSPSGKTMLDILEEAGLAKNVARGEVVDGKLKLKFTVDEKTGVKLTGIPGKKGQLEKHYYDSLMLDNLESEPGPKIFLFHSPLAELKPEELAAMEAMSVSLLPKGFDYYAGGHVHVVQHARLEKHPNIVYPGPIFPNNFSELEKLECGSMVLVENGAPRHVKLDLHPCIKVSVDVSGKNPADVQKIIADSLPNECKDAILLLRVAGKLNGRPSEIDFRTIINDCYAKGAYVVLKNTNKLESPEFEEIKVSQQSIDELEKKLIAEHAGKNHLSSEQEARLISGVMQILSAEKGDAEHSVDFEKRITDDSDHELGL